MLTGDALPELRTRVPGPRSRALAGRLAAVESPNITRVSPDAPIFWSAARGANVLDADGNLFIDLTAGFGVAFAGHANPGVVRALADQAEVLAHALGDVHPADIKVRLLERLAVLAPGDLGVAILATTGAEAVEAALKTAVLATGRAGILAFDGAYHGLTYGALATTSRSEFRAPFERQLFRGVRFAPYGDRDAATALAEAERLLDEAERDGPPIGTVIVEPVQGRAGIRVPGPGFLAGLRRLCDGRERVLIFDEVYTGFGRTGRWFACEHAGIVPDVIVVGKALSGALPISAAIASGALMRAWPPSKGEAIHTSTFLGNPIACAAALAHLDTIEAEALVERAARLGAVVRARLDDWVARYPHARSARGLGLLQGLVLDDGTETPAADVADAALGQGIIVLAEAPDLDVLAITPPAAITERQLGHALDTIERIIAARHA